MLQSESAPEPAVDVRPLPEPELVPALAAAPATLIESTPIAELIASPVPAAELEPAPARNPNEPTRWSYCEACGHAFIVAPMSAPRAGRPLRNRRRANRGCEQRRVAPRPQPSRQPQPSA